MRPISRHDSPIEGDFGDHRDAFPYLVSRIGLYCSYCERRIPTNLAVEHIQPKADHRYPHLAGRWDNFLLGCVNCNSTKLDKDVRLDRVFLVDRDNTFAAFSYTPDGRVEPSAALSGQAPRIASDTLSLTGLDKPIHETRDENGELVAIDRVAQRMETWLIAESSQEDLSNSRTGPLMRQIVRTALSSGYFSIWMTVFREDVEMRKMFIESFPGTAADCFDVNTTMPIIPRPGNGLPHCSKI